MALPTIEPKPKRVVEDTGFFIGSSVDVSEKFYAELGRIRSLIRIGGDLTEFYRRSTVGDRLLAARHVLHLHLWSCGSDTLLYLVQYPAHVLLLCVDTHLHLEDVPPGKRLIQLGRKAFEADLRAKSANLAASLRRLMARRPGGE